MQTDILVVLNNGYVNMYTFKDQEGNFHAISVHEEEEDDTNPDYVKVKNLKCGFRVEARVDRMFDPRSMYEKFSSFMWKS